MVGFQHQSDATAFLVELRERFRDFNLELHAEKTRILEFGRFAAQRREERGLGKPETFNFLSFTHACDKTRDGRFIVLRRTMAVRMRAKLRFIKQELRKRLHENLARDNPLAARWLPLPCVCQPYPEQRLRVMIRGKSPVR